jgi:hypothetical protein
MHFARILIINYKLNMINQNASPDKPNTPLSEEVLLHIVKILEESQGHITMTQFNVCFA